MEFRRSRWRLLLGLTALGLTGCADDEPVTHVEPPGPPTVITEPASDIGTTTVRLNARVYANDAPTTVYFDLALAKASTDSVLVEASRDTVSVHVDVLGLTPSISHEYQALAFNDLGTAEGEFDTFTTLTPNQPPQTQITGTPPNPNQTSYEVGLFWAGIDPDGSVVGFEWRISNNGADGVVDVADTLTVAWNRTVAADSVFVVSADLPAFPANASLFWQTHTFFVRAVDDAGDPDPSPASVSFTATTQPPQIHITSPVGSDTCVDVSGGTAIQWTGSDPDASDGLPIEVRWILPDLNPPSGGDCWSQAEFEAEGPFAGIAADDLRWSDWLPYAQTLEIPLPSRPAGTSALLGVEARDAAGAVTPDLTWNVNVLAVRFTN